MKILISGYYGHMGKVLKDMLLNDSELELACGVDINAKNINDENNNKIKVFEHFKDVDVDFDLIIDFSSHLATKDLIDFVIEKNKKLVLATTGQTKEELDMINEASKKVPIFFAANYSIGVSILIDLAKNVAKNMKDADIEIVETHHNRKLDAPSGTALKIAEGIKEVRPDANFVFGRNGNKKREKNDIGINSIRIGNVVGIHEVIVSTNNESITLKHEAYTRALFAEGAVRAAKFMEGKPAGMYKMQDMLKGG